MDGLLNIISSMSSYLILFMGVIYTFSSIIIFFPSKEEKQIKRMDRQELFMYVSHFVGFFILFIQTLEIKILILYVLQVIFFKTLIYLYQHRYRDCSRVLMNHTCFLLSIGFVMLTRINYDLAVKQFAMAVGGSAVAFIIPWLLNMAEDKLKSFRWVYGILGLLFLMSVFVVGKNINGSTNWIAIGPVRLQPSEFVKITYVFFLAAMLEEADKFKQILITTVFCAVHVLILVVEKDLGAAVLYFFVYIVMCSLATGQLIYALGAGGLGVIGGSLAYKIFSHVRVRFAAWSDPWSVIAGQGYQITQSLFAIASGGLLGSGLYQGQPTDIPVVESDFIFSAIAEELGVAFAICIILIYLCIFWHFVTIAMDAGNPFFKLLAFGYSFSFIFQVFLTIGGVTKFIPSTGVTLPLISYGGSSVVSTLLTFAVLQGVFILTYKNERGGVSDYGQTYRQEDN